MGRPYELIPISVNTCTQNFLGLVSHVFWFAVTSMCIKTFASHTFIDPSPYMNILYLLSFLDTQHYVNFGWTMG